MKNIIKKTLCLLLIILLCIPFAGCKRRITAQTVYHDRIAGLERYVLESMGDYIGFEEPYYNESKTGNFIYMKIYFLTDYLENRKEKSLDQVVNETRMLINEYMIDNPDFFLNDGYDIEIDFRILNDVMFSSANPTKKRVATISNRTYTIERNEEVLYEYLYTLELEDEDLEFIKTVSDIKMIYLMRSNKTQILDVVDHCPNIERVVVYTYEMKEELSELRPNVTFVAESDMGYAGIYKNQ